MKKPLTYLDRSGGKYLKFIFISYSHTDKNLVYPILNELFKNGVNYWYDTEVNAGDEWNEEVSNVIFDNYCIGSIVFLNSKSIHSNSIYEEIKRINEKNHKNNNFKIIPVILDKNYDKWEDLLGNSLKDNYSEFINKELEFRKLFKCGYRVFLNSNSKSNIIDEIIKLAKIKDFQADNVINLRDSNLGRIGLITMNGEYYINAGKYKMDLNENYNDIPWKLIYKNNNLLYFVSSYCIDFVTIDNIMSALRDIKMSAEFEKYIKEITIINEDLVVKYADLISDNIPTDYADKRRDSLLKLYWVKKDNGKEYNQYCLYNSINKKINKNINNYCITAGLRPLLIIDDNKLKETEHGKN